MQEVAARVKELEHKLKITEYSKDSEKELKMKQRRAGAARSRRVSKG